MGPIVGGRRPTSQQSFHSLKNNHSHHSRHQPTSAPPSTPRNVCQLPEIAARCIHVRSSSRNLVSTRSQQSITKMLLLISTVFILLNLPSYVIRLCVFFFTLARKDTPALLWCLQQFFMLLYYTNFSINFLLYAMCGITFRRCLEQLLRKVLKSMTRSRAETIAMVTTRQGVNPPGSESTTSAAENAVRKLRTVNFSTVLRCFKVQGNP
ncbi:hypothetical protein KM043_016157 [Ampulex compressa]|nr:hypothetical protein KM043_016157 [Ampulex compressa]